MKVDMRQHKGVRDAVHAGLSALRVQGRQIWGPYALQLDEIVIRMMVGVGDLARAVRGGGLPARMDGSAQAERELKEIQKELGNLILSTVRWIDDLGLDPMECLDLAIDAQERFAQSGKPR